MWGVGRIVFSAHAEVVPFLRTINEPYNCILRARGGSSGAEVGGEGVFLYSPRTRR